MICRMCLVDSAEMIDIFGEAGVELKIAPIITQHFWFEPKDDDPISNIICNDCWWKISNFHVYYTNIGSAHRKLSERFSVKQDSHQSNSEVQVFMKVEEDEHEIVAAESSEVLGEYQVSYDTVEKDDESKNFSDVDCNDESIEDVDDDGDYDNTEYHVTTRRTKYLEAQKSLEEFIKLEKCPETTAVTNVTETRITRSRKARKKASEVIKIRKESEYLRKSKEDDEKIAKHMKLKCELCSEEFTIFAEIKRHYRTDHKRKGYVICCNKKLYKRVLILDHINKHLNPEYFKCNVCNKVYSDKQCLKNHMIRHEPEDVKIYKCAECPRRYVKQYLLDQHKLIHTPLQDRQYFCEECGKAFPTNNLLQTHRRYVHEKAYGRMCHICAKVIRGKVLFKKHQLEHAGVTEPKVQCQKCGAWLKHEHSLKKHMARHKEELHEHICDVCGKIAPSKGALRSHIRYVHSSERKFQCSVCDKAFKKAIILKEHMTTHTGEVLYTCPHCPKTFNSSANMHSHRKKAHRKEWEEGRKNRGLPLDGTMNRIAEDTPIEIIFEASGEGVETESNEMSFSSNVPCDTITSVQ